MATDYPLDNYTAARILRAAFLLDEAGSLDRIRSFTKFDKVLLRSPFALEFAEVSSVSLLPVLAAEASFRIPEYALGHTLNVELDSKVTAGSNGEWYIRDKETFDASSEDPTANGSIVPVIGIDYTITSGPSSLIIKPEWLETRRIIQIIFSVDVASVFVKSNNRNSCWFSD